MRVDTLNDPANPHRLVFVGQYEIEVVRIAFSEHVQNAEQHGDPVAQGSFDRRISNWWPRNKQNRLVNERPILTRNALIVADRLRELHENTDMVTAEMRDALADIEDIDHFERRLAGVEWRDRLGSRALALAQVVELKFSDYIVEDRPQFDWDAGFAGILAPKLLGPG